ncbi:hypothetical protein Mapa_018824 [Marchantia paleacea]|nr:hypothetical protein Mapa_018824 [Marchantia paleacea]
MAYSFSFNLKEDRWGDSGEIKWRFNCHSLVGSGRSREDPLSSSLLEKNQYMPYQCMDDYLSSTG